jgi:hypothetical protein
MFPGRILSNLSERLEHLLTSLLVLTVLIGTYGGCILLARLLIALGWAA